MYDSAEENERRLRFFSDSVRRFGGGGDLETLRDLDKDLESIRPETLRCGDLDKLDRLYIMRLAECFEDSLGDGDRDILVDMVETDTDESGADRNRLGAPPSSRSSLCLSRFRPLSCSAFASCSSATPFLEVHVSKNSRKIVAEHRGLDICRDQKIRTF